MGPYAFLRPGTVLGPGSKVGAYCEVKNARVGRGSNRAGSGGPHLHEHVDLTRQLEFERSLFGLAFPRGMRIAFIPDGDLFQGIKSGKASVVTDEIDEEAKGYAARMREEIYDAPHGDPMELFEHVYVDPPPSYVEQRAMLQRELDANAEAK